MSKTTDEFDPKKAMLDFAQVNDVFRATPDYTQDDGQGLNVMTLSVQIETLDLMLDRVVRLGANLHLAMSDIKIDVTENVCDEKVEGKPVYSNETSRKNEITKRLAENEKYTAVGKMWEEAIAMERKIKHRLSHLHRVFEFSLLVWEAKNLGRRNRTS